MEDPPPPAPLARALRVAFPLVAVLWAIACLCYPLGRDQAAFCWVGDVIAGGGVPYRDAWEVKGPLLYYLFGALRALAGTSLVAIRAFDLLVLAAGAWATRRLGGLAAAGLLILWYAGGGYWDTCQADGWIGLLLVGWVAWLDSEPRHEVAGTALVGAVVLGLKPPLVILGALYPAYLAQVRGLPWGSALARASRAAFATAALGAAGAGALHLAGALEPLVEIYRGFLLGAYAAAYPAGLEVHGEYLARFFLTRFEAPLVALPVAAALHAGGPRERFAGTWLLLGTLAVAAQGRYFPYHWNVLLPALAILAAAGLRRLGSGPVGAVLAIATWVCAGYFPAREGVQAVAFLSGAQPRAAFLATLDHADYPAAALEVAATWIEANTPPGSPVLLWGLDASINALTGRPSVGRWGIAFRLMVNPDEAALAAERAQFLAAFDARPPSAVVLVQGDVIPYLSPRPSLHYIPGFPGLRARLEARYRTAQRIGPVQVLRRTPEQPDAPALPPALPPAPPDATTPRPDEGQGAIEGARGSGQR